MDAFGGRDKANSWDEKGGGARGPKGHKAISNPEKDSETLNRRKQEDLCYSPGPGTTLAFLKRVGAKTAV